MAAADPLELVYRLGITAVYLSLGLFLAYARPLTWPKRLLGLVFALLALQQGTVITGLVLTTPPGGARVWDAFWEDLRFLRNFAFLGFLWLYPTKARLDRWEGAAVAAFGAFLTLDLGLWLFARGFLDDAAWRAMLHGSGYGFLIMATGAVAAGFSRARELPAEDRHGAFLVLAVTGFSLFPFVGDRFVGLSAMALGYEPLAFTVPAALRGPCCGLAEVLIGAHFALPAALTLYLAWRRWTYAPLLLAAWGALGAATGAFAPAEGFSAFPNVLPVVLLLYAVARHGALGFRGMNRWTTLGLAGTMFLSFFLMAQSFALSLARDPLSLSLGLLGSLGLGALGAWAVLPGSAAWRPGADADSSERRLGPYQAALAAEIAAGADLAGTTSKLQGLRRELGITDTEHALMDYTMRKSGVPSAAAPALGAGQLFAGRYRVRRGLGREGSGPAYLCRDERAARDVVVKLLRVPGGAGEGLGAVVREARALAAVRHPRVVTLYDVEAVGDQAFLVMEYAEGGSLSARLAQGPLPPAEWSRLARDLLEGLEAAHAAGVVHRDVKPSNVLLDADRRAKLGDFGVARQPGLETTMGWSGEGDGAIGTVRYMSPEQARAKPVTERSDLYSAAALLYEAWTGKSYVESQPGESPLEVQMRVAGAQGFARPLQGPAALRAWFRKALQPDPAQRFGSAAAMRSALDVALGP